MSPELKSFYADRRLMWRNLAWLALLNVGMNASLGLVGPLTTLRMNSPAVGMGEGMIASVSSANSFLISFLVMYFSWKSDHTVSRWGRRIPFLWVSIPPIFLTVLLFPFSDSKWILFSFWVVQIFFMDVLSSTISLLPIDLTPRRLLARAGSLQSMAIGVVAFLVLRYGMRLADFSEKLPFLISGAVLAVTSLLAGLFIREPPIRQPTTERFKPWSALKIGLQDRRTIVLMVGVAMMNSFTVMYNMWIWLYAKNVLNLTRTNMGAALAWAPLLGLAVAFPCAWLIDRVSPYRLLAVYLLLVTLTGVAMNSVHSALGLAAVSIFWTGVTGLGGAAMMIVMRQAPRNAVGSFTSSAAFVVNLYNGMIVLVSGWVIEHTGRNYLLVFFLGAGLSAVGYGILCCYGWLTRNDPETAPGLEAAAP
jgi:MFS family permease